MQCAKAQLLMLHTFDSIPVRACELDLPASVPWGTKNIKPSQLGVSQFEKGLQVRGYTRHAITKVLDALLIAIELEQHVEPRRIGGSALMHWYSVLARLLQTEEVKSADTLIAGVLHDVVEDINSILGKVSHADKVGIIMHLTSRDVGLLVDMVTKLPSNRPRHEMNQREEEQYLRTQQYSRLEMYPELASRAVYIKSADRLDSFATLPFRVEHTLNNKGESHRDFIVRKLEETRRYFFEYVSRHTSQRHTQAFMQEFLDCCKQHKVNPGVFY